MAKSSIDPGVYKLLDKAKNNLAEMDHLLSGLLEESDELAWQQLAQESFFKGYSDKDSAYDNL